MSGVTRPSATATDEKLAAVSIEALLVVLVDDTDAALEPPPPPPAPAEPEHGIVGGREYDAECKGDCESAGGAAAPAAAAVLYAPVCSSEKLMLIGEDMMDQSPAGGG